MFLLVASASLGIVTLPCMGDKLRNISYMGKRTIAVSLASILSWLCNLLLALTFLTMIDTLGLPVVIIAVFGTVTVFGVLFSPETSNQ